MSEDCHNSDFQPAPEQIAQPLTLVEWSQDDIDWLATIHVKDQELA
jgi:hypothetical protein